MKPGRTMFYRSQTHCKLFRRDIQSRFGWHRFADWEGRRVGVPEIGDGNILSVLGTNTAEWGSVELLNNKVTKEQSCRTSLLCSLVVQNPSGRNVAVHTGLPKHVLASAAQALEFEDEDEKENEARLGNLFLENGQFLRQAARWLIMDVKLPKLGEGADSGVVVNVFVKEGDTVAGDQAISNWKMKRLWPQSRPPGRGSSPKYM